MSSVKIKLALFGAGFIAVVCAVIVSVCIAYLFFFDIFFYGKSTFLGYGKEAWIGPQEHHDSKLILNRKRDVVELFPVESSAAHKQNRDPHLRIVVIGDSMAYGLGVMEHQVFPRVLERKLKKIDEAARVWNVSIAGDHILDTYAKYVQVKDSIDPDFIVIGIVDNDLFIDQIGKYGNEGLKHDIDTRCVPGSESANTDLSSDPNLPPHEYFTRVLFPTFLPSTCNVQYLEEVLRGMEQDRKKILFMTYSQVDEVPIDDKAIQTMIDRRWASTEEEYSYKESFMMSVYLSKIRAHGFAIIQPPGGYEHVSEREAHPSRAAHEGFATLLFEYIEAHASR